MMRRALNPSMVAKPASLYAQAIEHDANAKRLVISGQVGVRPDGSMCEGYEEQAEQIWINIAAILTAADMTFQNIVAIRVYDVAPGNVQTYRKIRDRVLAGHLVAATYVIVAGLASPAFLTEIEVEAVMS
jgi:2-iminobutanoate/2-iminopropanoate deaminase